jgi:hypothetical protein
MERIRQYLDTLANREDIKVTNSKIEQRTRNAIRNEFTTLLVEVFNELVATDSVIVVRTKEGLGIALDNRKVGFIPIVLKPVFKDTAEDILELADEYEQELADKKAKAEKAAREKAEKIAKQKALAEENKRLKALEESLK